MSLLADAWTRLSILGETSPGFVRLRVKAVVACAAYAARSTSNGLEAILIEIDTQALPGSFERLVSKGVALRADPLAPGRFGRTRLVLSLEDCQYRDVFRALTDDVVSRLVAATSQAEAAAELVNRLSHWQRFLREFGTSGLSREQRVGLFGELVFLKELILERSSPVDGIRAWRGCTGATHDFQFETGAVEVKASAAVSPHSFRISNTGQLAIPENGVLYVDFVHIAEQEAGTHSLASLVEVIRAGLTGPARSKFDDCLSFAGYIDSQHELYELPKYSVLAQRFFRVGEGFPRLLGQQVPPGVENVSYDVALAACIPFEVEAARLWADIITTGGGC